MGDDPNKDLTFVRGDTSDRSEGSAGKAYSESKDGYTKTISVTATYKNDTCKEETITQWFGFYAGLGKASTYSHKAEFTMELARPGVVLSATGTPATHTYDANYYSDNEKHWRACSICGYVDEGPHTPETDDGDCTTAVRCSICAAETTPAQSHDFSGDLLHDEDGHWYACSHDGCTVTDTKQDHVWTEGEPNPAPTYSEDGERIDSCVCGETKAVVLPKLIDNIAPTVTLSSPAESITSISPIPVTITFSEDVTGFGIEDITVTNGEISNFVALSATVYTVDITPSAQGTVTVNVAAGVATDMAGNGNTAAAELSITYTI